MGLLQGIEPALSGVANPAVSPRAAEVRFISHHALPLISGSVLAGIAIGALTLVLLLLVDATRFRRPESWPRDPPAGPVRRDRGCARQHRPPGSQRDPDAHTSRWATTSPTTPSTVSPLTQKGTANVISDYLDLVGWSSRSRRG